MLEKSVTSNCLNEMYMMAFFLIGYYFERIYGYCSNLINYEQFLIVYSSAEIVSIARLIFIKNRNLNFDYYIKAIGLLVEIAKIYVYYTSVVQYYSYTDTCQQNWYSIIWNVMWVFYFMALLCFSCLIGCFICCLCCTSQ